MSDASSAATADRRRHLIAMLLGAVTVFLWLQWWPGDPTPSLTADADGLYHVHRAVRCLEDYPAVQAVDPRAHYPDGFRVHWPAPPTFLLATIAKLGGANPTPQSVADATAWLGPVLGVLMALLAALLLPARAGPLAYFALPLLTGLGGHALSLAGHGTFDHHVWTPIGLTVGAIALQKRQPGLTALAFFILFAFTPDAILFASLLLVVQAITQLSPDQPSPSRHELGAIGGTLLAFICHRLLTPDDLPLTDLDWSRFTLFAPLWVATLGGGARLLAVSPAGKRPLAIGGTILASILLLLVTGNFGPVTERFAGVNRLFVGEEISPFSMNGPIHPWYLLLVPLFIWCLVDLYRHRREIPKYPLLLLTTILLLLASKEMRYFKVTLPFIAIAIHRGLDQLSQRAAPNHQTWFYGAGTAIMLATSLHLGFLIRRSDNPFVRQRQTSLLSWLDAEYGPSPKTIAAAAPWDVGHHLNALAGMAVYVDPFNHEDVIPRLKLLYHARQPDQLRQVLLDHDLQLLITAAPEETLAGVDKNAAANYRVVGDTMHYDASVADSAYARLHLANGFGMEFPFLRPRYLSQIHAKTVLGQGDNAIRRNLSRDQAYQLVPGCEVRILNHQGKPLIIAFDVVKNDIERFTVRHAVRTAPTEPAVYRTALPAPVSEATFRVTSPYRFTIGDQTRELRIPPAAVATGKTFTIDFSDE